MKLIFTILALFSIIFSTICIWYKLLNKKIEFKSIKLYLTLFSLMIIAFLNYFNINAFVRIAVVTLCLIPFFRFLFKENLQKCILTPIFSQFLIMVSEVIYAIIASLFINLNDKHLEDIPWIALVSNFSNALIAYFLVTIPFVRKFYKFLINITSKIKKQHLIILFLIIIVIANILTMTVYYKVEFTYLMMISAGITLFCFSIIIYLLNTTNNYINVYDKYNTTLNSLKEYEDILDKYRISNHENKNQLLTIRNMLSKRDTKIINYIDTIVENKLKDNDKVMLDTSKIPAGGLRGLIYSKVLLMKNLKIDYEIEISSAVRTVDLINNINESTMLDICQIIGVYLDNSIQAVQNLKEKYINVEMYLNNSTLIISISNTYEGTIDLDKIDERGYTSKGQGHGYGLTLSKEIIDNNKKLSNEKRVSKGIFTQILKIKM